jgi:hypothetical protein
MKRIAKMIELRQGAIDHALHKIDPVKFDKELDAAVKALQIGQGLITANDLQQIIKQAGPMAKGMEPMKFWATYLAAVEEMGGARTGTAMTAVARQVLGGIMTPAVKQEWADVKMLDPDHKGWHQSKKGPVIDDPKKAIVGYDVFNNEGMQAFVDKVVKPHLIAAGYVTDKQINAELYKFGSTETARRLYSLYLTGQEQVEAEQRKIEGAKGLDAYDQIYKGGDYQQGIDSLTKSIQSLEEAAGGPAGQVIGSMATKIGEQINALAKTLHDNPQLVEIGTYALTAAAGLAVLSGSLLTFIGALRVGGWILGGPAAAGAAGAAAAGAAGATAAGVATTTTPTVPPIVPAPGPGAGLIAGFFGRVAPIALAEYYQDWIKTNWINPFLEDVLGKPHDLFGIGGSNTAKPPTIGSVFGSLPKILPYTPQPPAADIGLGAAGDLAERNYAERRSNAVWTSPEARRGAVMSSPAFAAAQKPINATLQATVNTTNVNQFNVDGQRIADVIAPVIIQKIEAAMHSSLSALEGMANDVAHRMSPGMAN